MSRLPVADDDPIEVPPEKRGLLESYPLGTILATPIFRRALMDARRGFRTPKSAFLDNQVFLVHTGPDKWKEAHLVDMELLLPGTKSDSDSDSSDDSDSADNAPKVREDPFRARLELGEEPVWDGRWDSLTEDSVIGHVEVALERTYEQFRAPLRYRQVYVDADATEEVVSEVLAPRPPAAPQRLRGAITFPEETLAAVHAMEGHLQHALMGLRKEEARMSAPLLDIATQGAIGNRLQVALSAQAKLAQKRSEWLQFVRGRLHDIILRLQGEEDVRQMDFLRGSYHLAPELWEFTFATFKGGELSYAMDVTVDFLGVATRAEIDTFNRSRSAGKEGKPWWMGEEPARPNDVLFFVSTVDKKERSVPVRRSSSHVRLRDLTEGHTTSHRLMLPPQMFGWDYPMFSNRRLERRSAPQPDPSYLARRPPPPPERTPRAQDTMDLQYIMGRFRGPPSAPSSQLDIETQPMGEDDEDPMEP